MISAYNFTTYTTLSKFLMKAQGSQKQILYNTVNMMNLPGQVTVQHGTLHVARDVANGRIKQ